MFKKAVLSLGVFALMLATQAFAQSSELNLACVSRTSSGVREVLVGLDGEMHALRTSSSSDEVISTRYYAVVIKLVGGENGAPARQEWEVLRDGEFELIGLDEFQGRVDSYHFVDKVNGNLYLCAPNGSVRANPAISRNN